MPNLVLVASSNEDITVVPLLCMGDQSSRMGTRKELLPFPDGLLAFEHALLTIHDALPTAGAIYISLHDESQLEGIRFRLETPLHRPITQLMPEAESNDDEHHHESPFPALRPIFDIQEYGDIGPAAGLLAAHAAHPDATLLVLGCNYPLLPPSALQQLILEYEPPLTCFMNADGFTEPLIALWSPKALDLLNENVREGKSGLNMVVGAIEGAKTIKPLREAWIAGCNTRDDWDEAMRILKEGESVRSD